VTEKLALAVWDEASVAVTECAPLVEPGTVKVAVKDPVDDVVTVDGEVATVVPSYLTVTTDDPANPVPETEIVAPTAPVDGVRVIEGIMLNVALEVFEEESVAVMVCAPLVELVGTLKLALNEPSLVVVMEVGVVGWAVPSYLMVMVDDPAKPVPETVTLVPVMPLTGLRTTDGWTVKTACPEWEESVAVTVWDPATDGGIVNDAVNTPETSVVAVATVVDPYVIVMVDEGEKLLPETVTVRPTIPELGVREIAGTVTVRVAFPTREPVPTLPVTVRVKLPPGVVPDVDIVSGVVVGVEVLPGKLTGLFKV